MRGYNDEAYRISLERINLVYNAFRAGKQPHPRRICDSIRSEVAMIEQKRWFQRTTNKPVSKAVTYESIIAKDKAQLKDYGFQRAQIDATYGPVEQELAA